MKAKRPSRRKHPVRKIEELLGAIEGKLATDFKFTVGDYIRLLQALEEMDSDEPKDIEVTWIDTLDDQSESEK